MTTCDCGGTHPHLDELVEFPCDYQFKAFGPNTKEFAAAVRRAVASVLPVPLDCIKTRPSSQGHYQCVTLLVRLHNGSQLRAIYAALQRVDGLTYLL